MQIALTHIVSPEINLCELSFVERTPIDYDRAVAQHDAYCDMLRECGLNVIELSVNRDFPDCTFIEDTAVVVDEVAVMANSGTESRRGEVRGIADELAKYRELYFIRHPGTLDGGDVLAVGLDRQDGAALHRLAVQVEAACATRRGVAADVGAGQPDVLADVLHQQRARLDVMGVRDPIDGDTDLHDDSPRS